MTEPEDLSAASGAFVERFAIEAKGSGILAGLSFAVKDLIDVQGYKTGCGNPSWRDTHPPAAANAVCVDQLLYAGAHCVGKTVADELAFGLNGENFFYGTPLNPRAPDRVPGGSSSGSASAVACGLVDFALGTDTGGSVRVPASNCGIFGMRSTHGVVSVAGVNPLAPSFDTVGIFSATCDVLSRVAAVLLACDIPRSVHVGTVHFLREAFEASVPEVNETLNRSADLVKNVFSGKTRTTSLRDIVGDHAAKELRNWYNIYSRIQWAEIWSCLGSWVSETSPSFGPRTKVSFELVKNVDRKETVEAIREREYLYRLLKKFLGPDDLICMPTAPTPAPIKGTLGVDRSTADYYLRTLEMTAVSGIGRLPQVTLPLGNVGGVPIGMSLLASQGMDGFLLAMAGMVASHTNLRSTG